MLKLLGKAIVCTFLVLLCGLVADLHVKILRIGGWIGMVYFTLLFLRYLNLLRDAILNPNPVIVIDADGIEDRRLQIGQIPWSDVTHVRIVRTRSVTGLSIDVKSEALYVSRMPAMARPFMKLFRALGVPVINTPFRDLDRSVEDAMRAITHFAPSLAEN